MSTFRSVVRPKKVKVTTDFAGVLNFAGRATAFEFTSGQSADFSSVTNEEHLIDGQIVEIYNQGVTNINIAAGLTADNILIDIEPKTTAVLIWTSIGVFKDIGGTAYIKNVELAVVDNRSDFDAHEQSIANPHSVTKTQTGLGNVDNTSDILKPVSTATAAAIDLKIDLALIGAPGGLAVLDETGELLPAQLNPITNEEVTVNASNPVVMTPSNGLVVLDSMVMSPLPGRHTVNFNSQYSSDPTSITSQAGVDLNDLITTLEGLTVTDATHAAAFGNEIIYPGVYTVQGATTGTASTTITLDAQNNPNAIFVFRLVGAFTVAASFNIDLINLANVNNVFFLATGAVTLAANTDFKATLISKSSITTAQGCIILGRLLSTIGAISPTDSNLSASTGSGVIPINSLEDFVVYSNSGALTNAGPSSYTGDLGAHTGAISGFTTASHIGNTYTSLYSLTHLIVGIYVNNILVPYSERSVMTTIETLGGIIPLYVPANIAAGHLLEIKGEVISGSVTLGNRTMTSLRVALL